MKFVIYLLFFIGTPLLFLALFGYFRSWQVETDPRQRFFIKGIVSEQYPSGFYKGKIEGRKSSIWKGKEFNAQTRDGVNIIGKDSKKEYPFMIYQAKGIQDHRKDVFVIDYDRTDNPWLLRFVKDEIVEVGKDKYLGKIHIIIPPHIPFTIGYFSLEK